MKDITDTVFCTTSIKSLVSVKSLLFYFQVQKVKTSIILFIT